VLFFTIIAQKHKKSTVIPATSQEKVRREKGCSGAFFLENGYRKMFITDTKITPPD